MNEMECFLAEQIKTLVPEYESVELKVKVNSTSYSVVFYATVDGERMQCFDMIDEGLFEEKDFDKVAKDIADYFRSLPDFNKEGLNKYIVNLL